MKREKGFAFTVIVIVLGFLITRPSVETEATSLDGSECEAFDPTATAMLKHLEDAHGVRMGADPECDLVLGKEGDRIRVALSEDLLGRLRADALPALELDGPVTLMSEQQYNAFLFMFHAYLTMAPPKPRAEGLSH